MKVGELVIGKKSKLIGEITFLFNDGTNRIKVEHYFTPKSNTIAIYYKDELEIYELEKR